MLPSQPRDRRPSLLAGWGRAAPSAARLVDVDVHSLAAAIKELPSRGGIARGLGRSYGDPAQNAGGHVIRLAGSNDQIHVDESAGTVTVGAGVSIDDLLAVIIPRGWFVPVTPGTRFVTIGGAIASDIHGKNHHADGSFGDHVTSMRLMLADTTVVEVGPNRDADLFWATVGGMGLTGIIVDATFTLIPIETSLMSVETRRLGDLDEIMAHMAETDAGVRYSVAWLDLLAHGRHLGRGVLTNADHATRSQLHGRSSIDPLAYDSGQLVAVPPLVPPGGVINRLSVTAFNELWYRKAPRVRSGELQSIPAYFHPLDLVGDWNRVYGRRGFLQYQFVVPFEAEGVLRTVVERLSAAALPIFLTVLKRFGPGNGGHLSFPTGGWTLAIDVPVRCAGLSPLLHGLDAMVLDAGGRHYLAKDFQTTAAAIRRGYPRLDEWLAVRARVDPAGTWASDLSRRLGLAPH
ncbi:MAG: FAD-binding oxidoreductase [Ilumatobacter sp.]|uniref:FAD-binding oxidoreductase n=1 Tax=Ilumatobacter sp. TaxID=1967498 RepID=UPI002639E459|nr:FAD-binding oxidoreductase [Ilumatobacter sp.]MDJ0767321.1 FAD-binding oxidoreductase [Ilumatobacter sp.]